MNTTNYTADNHSTTFAAFKAEASISFIRPWIKDAPEVAGYIHQKLEYRNTGKSTVEKPSQMVTVPLLALPVEYSQLSATHKQAITDYYLKVQRDLIKLQVQDGAKLIHWGAISLDAIVEFLTMERETNYLTKESVVAWVTANMVASFKQRGAQIAEAKGMDELTTAAQIAKTCNQYMDLFSKLAAKVPPLSQVQATSCQNQLLLLPEATHDRMYKVLADKLYKMLNPADASDDL